MRAILQLRRRWRQITACEGKVAAIVLAAGSSTRLGQPKQLVVHKGETLLGRMVRIALEAGCKPVIVVLGAVEQPCRQALAGFSSAQVRIVTNPAWGEGMSTSLKAGVAALVTQPNDQEPHFADGKAPRAATESALVLLTDQANLSVESLRRLLFAHASSDTPVTAAHYNGRVGVPAVFRSVEWGKLASVSGDKGARLLIQAHAGRTTAVDMPEAAFDLDTPADLANLK